MRCDIHTGVYYQAPGFPATPQSIFCLRVAIWVTNIKMWWLMFFQQTVGELLLEQKGKSKRRWTLLRRTTSRSPHTRPPSFSKYVQWPTRGNAQRSPDARGRFRRATLERGETHPKSFLAKSFAIFFSHLRELETMLSKVSNGPK